MLLDSAFRGVALGGDGTVRQPETGEPQHVELCIGQHVEGVTRCEVVTAGRHLRSEHGIHLHHQLIGGGDGFLVEVAHRSPGCRAVAGGAQIGEPGEVEDCDIGVVTLQQVAQIGSRWAVTEVDVEYHQVGIELTDGMSGLDRGACTTSVEAMTGAGIEQKVTQKGFVLDHENAAGEHSVIVAPRASAILVTDMARTQPDHLTSERHLGGRAAWLRAAVLGANDGLISTASLMVGVAAADSSRSAILVAGVAGLTAGALSMAAGEYVSVSSQRDTERADLERERRELGTDPEAEHEELVQIYQARGLSEPLARQVADELSQLDPLRVHARDELGVDTDELARPVQAAVVSATSFVVGAVIPILVVALVAGSLRVPLTMLVTLVGLVTLGAVGARLGGAPQRRAALRVLIGGALALAISLAIGSLTGAAI